MYGSFGPLPWQKAPGTPYGFDPNSLPFFEVSKNIKILSEAAYKESREFERVRMLLDKAKKIYFLGFGYQIDNMERLGISNLNANKSVMGTAYRLSHQDVKLVLNKISRCSAGMYHKHCDGNGQVLIHPRWVDRRGCV